MENVGKLGGEPCNALNSGEDSNVWEQDDGTAYIDRLEDLQEYEVIYLFSVAGCEEKMKNRRRGLKLVVLFAAPGHVPQQEE